MRVLVWRPSLGSVLPALGLLLALSLVAAGGREDEAVLRVAVPEPLLPAAAALVSAYTDTHPAAEVDLLPVGGEAEANRLVRAGEAEAALLAGPPAAAPRPPRPGPGLTVVQVGRETVVAVTSPFTMPGNLTLAQVETLLTGGRVGWSELSPGAAGRVRIYWLSGNGALPLLKDFLAGRGVPEQRLQPGRVVPSLAVLRQALLTDPEGLAFLPAELCPPGLCPLALEGVSPAAGDPASDGYALSRPLYLLLPAGRPSAAARRLAREASQRRTQPPRTLALAGDFLPDGPVGEAIRKHGPEWPWTGVKALTARCDLAVCNLEAPLSEIGWKINEYRGEPAAVKGVRAAGIDAVTLANDHILDYDDPALLSTLALLDREEIAHAGAGPTLAQARQPALLRLGETRVALLSYGRPELGRSRTGRRWEASPWSPGIAPAVAAEVQEDVRRAKKEAQVVLVAFHWGGAGEEAPRPEDRALARAAVEAGAAVVFGHGPGLVQGLEVHGNGLILYGLGAFVRQEEDPVRNLGFVARLSLVGERVQGLKLIPVRTEDGRVSLLQGQEAAEVLRLVWERSRQTPAEPAPSRPGQGSQPPSAAGNRSPVWYSALGGGHTHERRDRDRSTQPP